MIRINLLAPEFVKKEERTEFLVLGYLVLVALVVVGAVRFTLRLQKYQTLEGRIAKSQNELRRFETIAKQVDTLQAQKKVLETKKSIISSLMASRLVYPVYMERLLAMMPANLWLKAMNTQLQPDGKMAINIDAEALDNYAIADFVSALSAAPECSSVELGAIASATNGKSTTSAFRISFQYQPRKS